MATEFKLNYTGSEINRKLQTVDETKSNLENNYYTSAAIDAKIGEVNASIEELDASLETKADLVDGKIPVEQLPDDIGDNVDLSDYYTKTETDTVLSGKADLIEGKIPTEQLPDDIGGLTEVDWETNVINKPFYDTRTIRRSYYSQVESPNPVSFDITAFNMSAYKVSDLTPIKDEFPNVTFISYGVTKEPKISDVVLEADKIIGVQFTESTNDMYIIAYETGEATFEFNEIIATVNIPETGIYYINSLGAGVYEGTTVEIIIVDGELKPLDLKYLPENMALGYDTRKIYHFDSSKTPNPPSFPIAAFSVNGYKVFDLTPALEEFLDCKIIYNYDSNSSTTEITFTNKQIQLSWDNFWLIQSDQEYGFALCRSAGTFETDYQGISIVCEVPEPGIYLMWSQPPSNMTLEIILGGELKQIDPKFIPADLDFNLDDYYTKSEIDDILGNVDVVLDEISALIGE